MLHQTRSLTCCKYNGVISPRPHHHHAHEPAEHSADWFTNQPMEQSTNGCIHKVRDQSVRHHHCCLSFDMARQKMDPRSTPAQIERKRKLEAAIRASDRERWRRYHYLQSCRFADEYRRQLNQTHPPKYCVDHSETHEPHPTSQPTRCDSPDRRADL